RRGHAFPAVPPCSGRPFAARKRQTSTLGGLAPATPARPSESDDCSPARLKGEFGMRSAPVFQQPPALWSRARRPYYSSSTPYTSSVVGRTIHHDQAALKYLARSI